MSHPARRPRPFVLLLGLALIVSLGITPAAAEDKGSDPDLDAKARAKAIKGLGKDLARLARSPHRDKKKQEAVTLLEALETLGTSEAAHAALRGVAYEDETIRGRIFLLVRKHHDPSLIKPLTELLLEDKRYRRDFDLKERIAPALAVIGDAKVLPTLAALIRTDMDADVVAAACDALATFAEAPVKLKREPVKQMVSLFEITWNYMKSVNANHKHERQRFLKRYKVYGTALRAALETLTQQRFRTPVEWRRWWNDNKKAKIWKPAANRQG